MTNEISFAFGHAGDGDQYRKSGWSEPEPDGVWMLDRSSILSLPRLENLGTWRLVLETDVHYVASREKGGQRLDVLANGHPAASFTMPPTDGIECVIPAAALEEASSLTLEFVHPDAWCPAELHGGEGDQRELSFFLRRLRLEPSARQEPDAAVAADREVAVEAPEPPAPEPLLPTRPTPDRRASPAPEPSAGEANPAPAARVPEPQMSRPAPRPSPLPAQPASKPVPWWKKLLG